MSIEEIIKFYNDNTVDLIKDYQKNIIDNLNVVSKATSKYFYILISIIFIYYFLSSNTINSIKIGVIDIADLNIIKIFTPPVFIIIHIILHSFDFKREDLTHQAKIIFNLIYKIKLSEKDYKKHEYNELQLLYLPTYFPTEIGKKMQGSTVLGKINILSTFILVLIYGVILYSFEFYILKQLLLLWSDSYLAKCIFIISCLLFILLVYYILEHSKVKRKEENRNKYYLKRLVVKSPYIL